MKKINFMYGKIDELFADEANINFTPLRFILDFKKITPVIDTRSKVESNFLVTHSLISIDPLHVKLFSDLLIKTINKYEKTFGKIEKSKAIKIAEKHVKEIVPKTDTKPNYVG